VLHQDADSTIQKQRRIDAIQMADHQKLKQKKRSEDILE